MPARLAAPRLAALATAVPPYRLDQEEVMERLTGWWGGLPAFERLRPVFANSGIRQRYSAVPLDWFEQPHDWRERNDAYLKTALQLGEIVAGRALDQANTAAQEVGAIVVVSTTGVATPSLDALLIEQLRLPRTVQRLPIFGLGCAGGTIGLARAATIAASMPGKAVLLVVVELCTLAFRRDQPSKSDIVASALFGDGAAAAVLRHGGIGPAIIGGGEHTWPETLDIMGWDVAADGLRAIFSRDIPRLVTAELGAAARGFLAEHGLTLADIDRPVCHPGGPKVIAACEEALALRPGALDDARAVLQRFGNMSAPTVLFVLERVLARVEPVGEDWRRALMVSLGPGFTAGLVVLSRE